MSDVPFLCDYRRAVEITDAYPYREISDYLQGFRDRVDQTFATLGLLRRAPPSSPGRLRQHCSLSR